MAQYVSLQDVARAIGVHYVKLATFFHVCGGKPARSPGRISSLQTSGRVDGFEVESMIDFMSRCSRRMTPAAADALRKMARPADAVLT